ncbi:hypothetical protein B0H63DRAFT_111182 [Podospora didyma]|uniref:Uncharacterized protein n=1 Tax=Podospora didyma TaxID=330526 RepID=A0AAE0NZ84_9PEZI|nr:hypothetical protein B0H63DRAFT_111182 [Podospora didyma]
MDALRHLIGNIPDWLRRLDELNGQIEQRQIELAKLTEPQKAADARNGTSSPPKSIRNKGSTESLRPCDEPEAHPREATPQPEAETNVAVVAAAADGAADAVAAASGDRPPSSPAEAQSPSAIQRQTNLVRAAGQARARATLRKRQRTDSMISAEGFVPKYRTRSMILVYYDSYVQIFFEELVKFVSASRNMMRKAKMAAKVAQIKRLAELEMPSDDDDNDDGDRSLVPDLSMEPTVTVMPALPAVSSPKPALIVATTPPNGAMSSAIEAEPPSYKDEGEESLEALRFISSRRTQPGNERSANLLMARSALGRPMYPRAGGARGSYRTGMPTMEKQAPDVYDELDKGLEYVQSMCEHAAHQFLRDGDCAEEVSNIQRRLRETNELADKETERVKKEGGPEVVEEPTRGRSYRPQSMRKDFLGSSKDMKPIEVDEGIQDMGQEVIPKFSFKSTRLMQT